MGIFSLTSNKKLPPIPSCALPQPKHDLANVLDVGLSLCLICAIPHPHLLAIHRKLDYGVVVAQSLPILIRLAFNLLFQRLQGTRRHHPRNPHELVVLCLSSRLSFLDKLLALAHLLVRVLNERLSNVTYPIFNLLLEVLALGVIFGNVLQPPTSRHSDLVLQDLVGEDVGATNAPRCVHSILVELDFARLDVRCLYELIFVAIPILLL